MKTIVFVLAIVCLLFSGCYPRGSLGDTELYNVAEVVESALPFGMGRVDSHDFPTLLERDKVGRELYEYRNQFFKHYVIIQKTEDPLVWYYRDICYLSTFVQGDNFTDEEIAWLKEANDWDKPLSLEKMSSLNYRDDIPDIEDRFSLEEKLRQYFELENENIALTMDGMERDSYGKQIVRVTIDDNSKQTFQAYLILSKYSNGNHVIYNSKEISTDLDCRDEIITFREKYWDKAE